MFEEILSATIRGATPLLLAALGEVISQRAGVLNIGIEGMMLIGAFFGMVGSFYTAEFAMIAPWFGLLMAGLSGLIAAALFALCAIRLRGDQVIIGHGDDALGIRFNRSRLSTTLRHNWDRTRGASVPAD